jgi:hypothetical protein
MNNYNKNSRENTTYHSNSNKENLFFRVFRQKDLNVNRNKGFKLKSIKRIE